MTADITLTIPAHIAVAVSDALAGPAMVRARRQAERELDGDAEDVWGRTSEEDDALNFAAIRDLLRLSREAYGLPSDDDSVRACWRDLVADARRDLGEGAA